MRGAKGVMGTNADCRDQGDHRDQGEGRNLGTEGTGRWQGQGIPET